MVETKPSQQNFLEQILYYWHAILRWKWTGLTVAFIILVITVGRIFVFPHVYSARGTIWIDESSNILPFEDFNRLSGEINAQSHSMLLTSRSLVAEVIDRLKLADNPDFTGGKKISSERSASKDTTKYREKLIDNFLQNLSVTPISGTKLIEVTFNHQNPELAAQILNTLFDSYIEMLVKRKYYASEQATEFLTNQMAALQKDIEENEKKLSELSTEQGILPTSSAEAPLLTKITEVNAALTSATLDRVNKLSYYNQLKSMRPEDISVTDSNSALAKLKEQYLLLSREYARRLANIKPEYPEMQKLKSEIEATYEALQAEKENMIKSAYADYLGALAKEQNLQRLLDELKAQVYKTNSNVILYNSLKIETDNKKALLEALSKRQSETDLASRLKDLQALNVWVVDKASVPVDPSFPNRKKTLLIGLILALIGGAGTSLFINYLVATVKSSRDVSQAIGLATIGTIPAFEKEFKPKGPLAEYRSLRNLLSGRPNPGDKRSKKTGKIKEKADLSPTVPGTRGQIAAHRIELILAREPQSIQAESFRSIRTSLMLSLMDSNRKAFLFSSPLSQDGKSSVISNLGLALAQAHKKVVIVDSDLRKPRQDKIFELDYSWGLSHFLSSIVDATEVILPTRYTNLFLVPAGNAQIPPLEALLSDKMRAFITFLRQQYDYVLLDSPPLLAISDALVLSKMVDNLILVVRAGQTPISALKQVKAKLDAHHLNCLGVIINGVSLLEQEGYYSRQYYHYSKPL